jgi:hypothetical protein
MQRKISSGIVSLGFGRLGLGGFCSNRLGDRRFNLGFNDRLNLFLDQRSGFDYWYRLRHGLDFGRQRSGIALDVGARLAHFHLNGARLACAIRLADFTGLLARDGDLGFPSLGAAAVHFAQMGAALAGLWPKAKKRESRRPSAS